MLDPITTTLHDVQIKLKKILHSGAILCGHAIANDLTALKMTHPFLVDSAYIYPHLRGFPYKHKLSYLATKYLNRSIQAAGGRVGHDSIEDARAALDLVKMKCEKGPVWGTLEAGKEDIFKRLSRTMRPKRHSSAVTDEPRTGAIVDWPKVVSAYSASADVSIPCRDDDDVVKGIQTAIRGTADDTNPSAGGVDFVWARLRELEVLRGWTSRAQLDENGATNVEERSSKDNHYPLSTSLAEAVSKTVRSIEAIYHDLPPCTAFIVYSGSGDPREMQKLQATERRTDEETAALEAAVSKAMQGIAFITVR
ncbi:MAG: hypothetical protein M1824_002933 [Vezdaea acicularis]|nr:MAG: hypothetical protein M1824_002933 [Vezdaea acicularis]